MRRLSGRRVLVIEDEGIAALALCEMLELEGAVVVGPAATLANATAMATAQALDAAVLDVNLQGQLSFAVADILAARGVPFVFLTGYTLDALPPQHAGQTVLTKPAGGAEVCSALATALGLTA